MTRGKDVVQSSAARQDGLAIERVEARLTGTFGVADEDASTLTLDQTGVAVVTYRIYHVAGDVIKRSGDIVRKVVLDVEEARVVHDYATRQRLLNDLGFEDAGPPPIPAMSIQAAGSNGADRPDGVTEDGEIVPLVDYPEDDSDAWEDPEPPPATGAPVVYT
jgi:hypothetical protein